MYANKDLNLTPEAIREFDTGATRSPLQDKLQYEGFFSPLVLRRRAQYMHKHRIQSDGNVRTADNWQNGMPLDSYIDSGTRHFMDWWLHHRGQGTKAEEPIEDAICALMFNLEGYLHEILKVNDATPNRAAKRDSPVYTLYRGAGKAKGSAVSADCDG